MMTIHLDYFESLLTDFYESRVKVPLLSESVSYSLRAGGKRLRPLLFLEMLEGFGVRLQRSHYQIALAIEMIHTGSLIHDDLPAMDNDDYRRGKLTNHKVFGEATAILAGDALFLDSWAIIAGNELSPDIKIRLIEEFSEAAGAEGMVAGQVLDMEAEKKRLTLDDLKKLHRLKTGKLLTFSFVAAAIIAEREDLEKIRQTGQQLGLAFQIRDDILDVTSDFASLGKTPGKDEKEQKSTYVRLLGLDEAKTELTELLTEVRDSLTGLSDFDATAVLQRVQGLEL